MAEEQNKDSISLISETQQKAQYKEQTDFDFFLRIMKESFAVIEKLESIAYKPIEMMSGGGWEKREDGAIIEVKNKGTIALLQALKTLPSLSKTVKEYPKPKDKELQKFKKYFENSLSLYTSASTAGARYWRNPSRINQGFFLGLMETARDELKKSHDSLDRFRGREKG